MPIYWPPDIPGRNIRWALSAQTVSSGASLAGTTRRIRTDGGGYWMATLGEAPIGGVASIRLARVLDGVLEGGATAVIVPYRDPLLTVTPAEVTFADGAEFSDGAGFFGATGISAFADAPAPLRSVTLAAVFAGWTPQGGECFSIDHATQGRRLYRIVGIDGSTLTIRPPLREAIDAGATLDFAAPSCVMRLANPASLVPALEFNRYGAISPEFEEWFE